MGSGIAQVSAQSGYRTIQFDLSGEMIEKSRKGIDMSLSKLVEKEKISAEEKQAILDRILFTTRAEDCIADMIIEAIIEKKEAKVSLFTQLAALNSSDTILATNTSSIPVSEIAAAVSHPERIVGMHFFQSGSIDETGGSNTRRCYFCGSNATDHRYQQRDGESTGSL